MLNGDLFTISVPTMNASSVSQAEEVVIADGCSSNTNYYTDSGSRGTCCCSCDKEMVAIQ